MAVFHSPFTILSHPTSFNRYAGAFNTRANMGFYAAKCGSLYEWDDCRTATEIIFAFGVEPEVRGPSSPHSQHHLQRATPCARVTPTNPLHVVNHRLVFLGC